MTSWTMASTALYLQRLMIERFSDKVPDAWIADSFSRNLSSLAFIVFLGSASCGATSASGNAESERVAFADACYVFTADTRGTQTIATGSSDQRLCLSAGRASCQ